MNIAELEAGDKAEDKALDKAEFEAMPEPKSVVVAWQSGDSPGVGIEASVVAVFAYEEHMMAPCEKTQWTQPEVPAVVQVGATAVEPELLDKPETVEFDPFVEDMVGILDASAGYWVGFEALVWMSIAGKETEPGGKLGGKLGGKEEVVLLPVDAGQTLGMRL